MKIPIRKPTFIFLALAYLVGSGFAPLSHIDFIPGDSHAPREFRTHDCGSHERHRPLGSDDNCPICQRIHQMSTTLTTPPRGMVVSVRQLPVLRSSVHQLLASHSSLYERGPPLFLA